MASGCVKPRFLYKQFTYSGGSLASGSSRTITATNFNYAVPDGYVAVGVMDARSGHNSLTLRAVDLRSSNMMMVYNYSGSSVSSHTAAIKVLFTLDTNETTV